MTESKNSGLSLFWITISALAIIAAFSLISFLQQRADDSAGSSSGIMICGAESRYSRSQYSDYRDYSGSDFLELPDSTRDQLSVIMIRDKYAVPEDDLCEYSGQKISDCMDSNAERFPSETIYSTASMCARQIEQDMKN